MLTVQDGTPSNIPISRIPDITFTSKDFETKTPNLDDPVVISATTGDLLIRKVLLDQGSSADVMFLSTFKKMQLNEKVLQPSSDELVGFSRERVPVTEKGSIATVHLDRREVRQCYNACVKVAQTPATRINSVYNASDIPALAELDPQINNEQRPTPVDDLNKISLTEDKNQYTNIGSTLPAGYTQQVTDLLRANADLFAWTPADMPGIHPDAICHRLPLDHKARQVKQKRRQLGKERIEAATKETQKLISAGFIREIQFTSRLANAVMVKNNLGKWQMCMDFTNLNRACPKDSYPLPCIDKLVDNTSGYQILSFMDAYSAYNQILMHPADEEKTTFITDQGNFCYRVMPFGLKNAGATYQSLMDKIFQKQIGKNMEVQRGATTHRKASRPIKISTNNGNKIGSLLQHTTKIKEVRMDREMRKRICRVQTDTIITTHTGKTKTRPDLAGRLTKWSIELSEDDIEYQPRGPLKSQPLADFVAEFTTTPDSYSKWELYVDGASNEGGGGAGIVLRDNNELITEQSIKYMFPISNNQSEYEALLASLHLAKECGIQSIKVYCDSLLVVQQVNDLIQVREPSLEQYHAQVKQLITQFQNFQITHINRNENHRADILSKLATSRKPEDKTNLSQITLEYPSTCNNLVLSLSRAKDWRTPYFTFLKLGEVPQEEPNQKLFRRKASSFTIIRDNLYRRGFSRSLLKCLGEEEADLAMTEAHEEICGTHVGGRSLAAKILRAGYYWPSLNKDCLEKVRKCDRHLRKKEILAKGEWAELVPEILWGYNTTPQNSTNKTPFKLVFGSNAMIPVEISQGSIRTNHFKDGVNSQTRKTELDTLEKVRDEARIRSEAMQKIIRNKYNKRVRPWTLQQGYLVLRRLEDVQNPPGQGKLIANWEGPFRITKVHSRGAYSIQILEGVDLPNTWNISSLRLYHT
ncbi:uncharacterized protein [Arachis hypogaea]|uniref:uncharacterized protein n=1 Tax=Arachis hypogaea TaxID=3818 RepID=UPI003B2113B4